MTAAHGALQHQFDTYDQQREASTLGMWVFLVTEIMFFGGLFVAYAVFRYRFPEAAQAGSRQLDLTLGALNTAVLITSSLTMVMAVKASQLGKARRIVGNLVATMALGTVFLGIKMLEYKGKFDHHLIPGYDFRLDAPDANLVEGFFSLYFAMTGLHALHMIIGVVVLAALIRPAARGVYDAEYHNPVECAGLYWHFVEIVWIFLFPVLYLIGRN